VRGENCWEASCRATTINVNVKPVMVITDVASDWRNAVAESRPLGHPNRASR
jgi:hypothetical protein